MPACINGTLECHVARIEFKDGVIDGHVFYFRVRSKKADGEDSRFKTWRHKQGAVSIYEYIIMLHSMVAHVGLIIHPKFLNASCSFW